MVKTTTKSASGTAAAAATAVDPLQDPLMAPPVDGPSTSGGITSGDLQKALTLVHVFGQNTIGPSGVPTAVFGGLHGLHTQWLNVEINLRAGLIDESKALREYHHLNTQIHAFMSMVPDGLHPDLDALKAKAQANLGTYILRAVDIEQQEAIKPEDRQAVSAIQDALMSAGKRS